MENLNIEDNTIDEQNYQLWKQELNERRRAKRQSQQNNNEKMRVPRAPHRYFEDAAKSRIEALSATHVQAESTVDMFRRIDEILEAS